VTGYVRRGNNNGNYGDTNGDGGYGNGRTRTDNGNAGYNRRIVANSVATRGGSKMIGGASSLGGDRGHDELLDARVSQQQNQHEGQNFANGDTSCNE
jgi:hypothetical protein